MPLALPHDAFSLCWSCRYCDGSIAITVTRRIGGKDRWLDDWENVCLSPAEHVASDDKQECSGYVKEENNL